MDTISSHIKARISHESHIEKGIQNLFIILYVVSLAKANCNQAQFSILSVCSVDCQSLHSKINRKLEKKDQQIMKIRLGVVLVHREVNVLVLSVFWDQLSPLSHHTILLLLLT